jgi:hypothetical protein
MCWDFGEGRRRSPFGGIGSLSLEEAKLEGGAAAEEVKRDASLPPPNAER